MRNLMVNPDDVIRVPDTDEFWHSLMYVGDKELEETRLWWSNNLKRELTKEDAQEIRVNLFSLVRFIVQMDAREQAKAAGQKVVDYQKVHKLRYDIRLLEKQLDDLRKMIKRWSKEEPQRQPLEEAAGSLKKLLEEKQHKLILEMHPEREGKAESPLSKV